MVNYLMRKMYSKNMNIENDKTFLKFINNKKRKSPQTKRKLTGTIQAYCDFVGKTPTELIKE